MPLWMKTIKPSRSWYEEEDNFFTSPCFFPFSLAHVTVVILILTQVIVKDEKKKNGNVINIMEIVSNLCPIFARFFTTRKKMLVPAFMALRRRPSR